MFTSLIIEGIKISLFGDFRVFCCREEFTGRAFRVGFGVVIFEGRWWFRRSVRLRFINLLFKISILVVE